MAKTIQLNITIDRIIKTAAKGAYILERRLTEKRRHRQKIPHAGSLGSGADKTTCSFEDK